MIRFRHVPVLAVLSLCGLTATSLRAQVDGLLQIDDPIHVFLERQQVMGRLAGAHLEHLPLSSYEARSYLERLTPDSVYASLTWIEQTQLKRWLQAESSPAVQEARSYVPQVFGNGLDLGSVAGEGFALQVNPLLYLSSGYAFRDGFSSESDAYPYWQSARGVRLSGHVSRIFFETRLLEVQRLPLRPEFYKFSAPRIGRTKWDVTGETPYSEAARTPYDFFEATGAVGLRSRFFEVRFGRDRNLWGAGRSSVQLSNFAPVYDQLQIRTTVWRLQYVNLFAGLTDIRSIEAPPLSEGTAPEQIFPRRYAAFHRLSIDLPYRLEAHLFESIVFATDTLGRRDGFDLSYMNPVIFYRAVESDRGSPDNAVVGAGLSWLARPGLKLYGEFVLDELRFRELTDPGDGWWGNKWAALAGVHAVDPIPGVPMSVRLEHARNRPFMYSHRETANAYVHFADLLGHPAGPNATDWALYLRTQPTPDVEAGLNMALTRRGRNPEGVNYGSDPLIPYLENRPLDANGLPTEYGYTMLIGTPQFVVFGEFYGAYQLLPGLFVQAAVQAEAVDDKDFGSDWYVVPHLTIRWGLPFQSARY